MISTIVSKLLIFPDELWTHDDSERDSAVSKTLKNLGTVFNWWTPMNSKNDIGTGGDGEFEWRIPADDNTGYIEIDRDGEKYICIYT